MAQKRDSRRRADGSPRQSKGAMKGAEEVGHEAAMRNIDAMVEEWQAKVEKFSRIASQMPEPFKSEMMKKVVEAQKEVEFFESQKRFCNR